MLLFRSSDRDFELSAAGIRYLAGCYRYFEILDCGLARLWLQAKEIHLMPTSLLELYRARLVERAGRASHLKQGVLNTASAAEFEPYTVTGA